MDELADAISHILKDYHAYNGFDFTTQHVIKWVNQFEEADRQFVLEEFLHILKQGIYVSEDKGRALLIAAVKRLAAKYNYSKVVDFLANVDFLSLQKPLKSQNVLLGILNEELQRHYGIEIKDCGKKSKKYALYIDDILVSGNSVYNDLAGHKAGWLELEDENGVTNSDKIIKKEKILIVSVFCLHNWHSIEWRLKGKFGDDIRKKIVYDFYYEVQNLRVFFNQKLNFAYPVFDGNEAVEEYFNSIDETSFKEVAFRKEDAPRVEGFYSSPANRTRFENILLHEGIKIFAKVAKLGSFQRPLGVTPPFHKTLGTGTLFFTWRNISNTTPIVFWWKVNWHPLFELINRG